MKFKGRLALVIFVLFLAVIFSLKRRFYRRRPVELEKYLEDNKDRGHILDDDLDAKVLDSLDANVINCNSSVLEWTGNQYDSESALIEQPICSHFANITTVIFVYSNHTNSEQRSLIRSTFGRAEIRAKYKFKLLFVIGYGERSDRTRDELNAVLIQREQMVYQDILQIRTSDILENDAFKALEGLKWILKCATSVVNIIKVGDNTVPNLPLLFNDLNSRNYEAAHNEFFCQLVTGQMIEDKNKNITVEDAKSHKRVPIKIYPPFCRNSLIVLSRFVARQLLKAAEKRPLFKIEDVYLTGLLRETVCLPVPRRRMRSPKVVKNRSHTLGIYHFITFRKVNPDAFSKTWESALIFNRLIEK